MMLDGNPIPHYLSSKFDFFFFSQDSQVSEDTFYMTVLLKTGTRLYLLLK